MFCPCSKKQRRDHFVVTGKLICVFVFAYADCWFSHEAHLLLHMSSLICITCVQSITCVQ